MSWAEEQDWFGLEDMALEAQLRAEKAKELIKQGIWFTAQQEPVIIRFMTDRHLCNCIKMIEEGRLSREWALPYLKQEKIRRYEQGKTFFR